MFDLIHFYFEQEAVAEEEYAAARSRMRTELYGRLYEQAYSWGEGGSKPQKEFGTQEVGVDPFSGEQRLKRNQPYIPPTHFDPTSDRPYGPLIDPPLG